MEKDKSPLPVFEDGKVKHFSIFSEKIHYNAKLSRFAVSYNSKLGTLDCGCCLRKVTCTHNAMCIWYLSQYEKLTNKDLPVSKRIHLNFKIKPIPGNRKKPIPFLHTNMKELGRSPQQYSQRKIVDRNISCMPQTSCSQKKPGGERV